MTTASTMTIAVTDSLTVHTLVSLLVSVSSMAQITCYTSFLNNATSWTVVLILALSLFTNYTRRQRAQKANLAFMHNMQNQQGGGGYNPGGGGGYHPGGYNPGSGYNPGGGNAGAGYNPSPYTPNSAQNRYSAPNYPPPRVTTPPPGGMSYYQPPPGPPPSHETQFQNPENTYDPTNAPQVPPPSYQKN